MVFARMMEVRTCAWLVIVFFFQTDGYVAKGDRNCTILGYLSDPTSNQFDRTLSEISLPDLDISDLDLIPEKVAIGHDCTVQLEINWCSVDMVPETQGCLTVGSVLAAVTPGLRVGDIFQAGGASNPANWPIDQAYVDRCGQSLHISAANKPDFDLVPGVLQVRQAEINLQYSFATKDYDLDFTSMLLIGRKKFRVSVKQNNTCVEVSGKALQSQVMIGQFISDVTSSLVPGNLIRDAIESMKLENVILSDLSVKVVITDGGLAVQFGFNAGISPNMNMFTITVNRGTHGNGNALSVVVSGEYTNLRPAYLVRQLTGADVSFLPILGDLYVPNLAVLTANNDFTCILIPLNLDAFPEINEAAKGCSLVFQCPSGIEFSPCILSISPSGIVFRLPEGYSIPIRELLAGFIDSLQPILPPGFLLDEFLGLSFHMFSYDVGKQILRVSIIQPENLFLIDKGLVFTNSKLSLNISFASDSLSRFGVDLSSTWHIQDVDVALRIYKPQGNPTWMAEGRPDVDIPVGALIQKFAVSVIPAGPIREGAKKIGFDAFYIVRPYVQVFLGDNSIAAKISGTARFGISDAATIESFIGKVRGVTVMALGLVLQRVPFTELVDKITDGHINLRAIPGSRVLDEMKVALLFASGFIPKGTEYAHFDAPLLSQMDVIDGLSLAASFSIPSECHYDKFCRVLRRVIGSQTVLIISGTIKTNGLRLKAVVPANISIIEGVAITDVGFEVEVGSRNLIGLMGTLTLYEPKSVFPYPIVLTGQIGVSTSGVYIKMSMKGIWENAFNITFIAVGNLNFQVAVSPDPILISVLELGGEVKIGFRDAFNAQPIHASIYVGIDRLNPIQNYFSGRINKLTVASIVKAFEPTVSLPPVLDDVGFLEGLNLSYALKQRMLPNGIAIKMGFYLRGMLSIFDFKVWADAKVSINGVFLNMTIPPLDIGNGLIILKGLRKGSGPLILIDLRWIPPNAVVKIQAKATILLLTKIVDISIDHSGMHFELEGKMLNLFEARLRLQARYISLKQSDFMVEGRFQQQVLQTAKDKTIQALNKYYKSAETAIESAKSSVDKARDAFNKAADTVGSKRQEVEDAHIAFDDAVINIAGARRHVESKKAAFDIASNAVADARRTVDSKNRDLDNAVRSLNRAELVVQSKQRNFDNAIRTLEQKKRDVSGAQMYLNRVRDDFRRKEATCPRPCRKKRDTQDVFREKDSAKSVLVTSGERKLVKRGWGDISRFFEERKEEVARGAKCAALQFARQTCLAGLRVIQGSISAASGSLDGAKHSLTAIQKITDTSRVSLDVAKVGLGVAKGSVNLGRGWLEAAKFTLKAAEDVTKGSKVFLDAADEVLAAAQVTVDKSRDVLDVAKAALTAAEAVVRSSQGIVNVTIGVLDVAKIANRFGVKIGETLARSLGLVDIRELSFRVRLAVAQSGSFTVMIRASLFEQDESEYSLDIDLYSFDDFIKVLVDKMKDTFEHL